MRFSRELLPGKGHIGALNSEVNVEITCSFSQGKILEMQCDLLISTFQNLKSTTLVKESIDRISDGSSSHCAHALNLGLRKALELKRKKKEPPGVLLKCPNSSCFRGWYNTGAPYSVIESESAVYCPGCVHYYGNYYLQCAGCNYQRTSSSYTSCQSCGKKFI